MWAELCEWICLHVDLIHTYYENIDFQISYGYFSLCDSYILIFVENNVHYVIINNRVNEVAGRNLNLENIA